MQYVYRVIVETDTKEHADRVMEERTDFDEEYFELSTTRDTVRVAGMFGVCEVPALETFQYVISWEES